MKCCAVGLIALSLLLAVSQVIANPLSCRTAVDARKFSEEHGQKLVWMGIIQGGSMVAEIWQSADSKWLLSLLTPMNVSCLQLYGQGGQIVKPERQAYKQPEVQTP
tara:strand:+ start:357 stop:674 length:318 start_codon:yes stop_codon:yes gene_type:complete